MREILLAYLTLTRLRAGALAAMPFGLGYLIAGRDAPGEAVGWWFFAVAYHAYACVLNDLADVRTDRLNPARREAPLVAGDLMVMGAVKAAVLLAITLLAALAALPSASRLPLLGLIALVTYGNLRQKRSTWVPPPLMDVLFGVAMAAPIVVVANAYEPAGPAFAVWAFTISFGLQMDLFNGVAGNLKDIAHDQLVGARTTALALGVKPVGTHIFYTSRYWIYCVGLLLAGFGTSILAILSTENSAATALQVVLVTSLYSMSLYSLVRLLTGRRPPSSNGRDPFLIGQFLSVPISLLAFTGVWQSLGLLALVVTWTVTFPRFERLLASSASRRLG